MSVSKGRYLARFRGSSLPGVSERDSGAAGCPCVLGRDGRPSRQMAVRGGTAAPSAHPVATDRGPGGCCSCIHGFVPCRVPREWARLGKAV